MLRARQVVFSAAILKISSRISFVTGLLPIGLRTREMSRQYSWKPQPCQRTTVSGDTIIRVFFHEDQKRHKVTQNNLSATPTLGREFCRLNTESCWRARDSQLAGSAGSETTDL